MEILTGRDNGKLSNFKCKLYNTVVAADARQCRPVFAKLPDSRPESSITMRKANIKTHVNKEARILLVLVFFNLCLFQVLPAAAQQKCADDLVVLSSGHGAEEGKIFLDTDRTIESTVTITSSRIDNIVCSHRLPYTFLVNRAYRHFEVLNFARKDAQAPSWFGPYHCSVVVGVTSKLPTSSYIYSLPYSASEEFEIGQSYRGSFTHKAGTPDEYAVDFNMPEGTPVLAARGGTVVAYRSDSNSGGDTLEYSDCANYVYIKHNDGTYAFYAHLKYNGVTVRLGQTVAAGTQIGYSGQTGLVTCPHLHFRVYRLVNATTIKSMPFHMQTKNGILSELEEGEVY